MARMPDAIWHRCPGTEPAIDPTQVIYHTAVMRDLDALQNYFCGGGSGGIESHFGVGGRWGSSPAEDGEARQWRDSQEQADANRTANRRPDGTGAISIETTDNAPRFPDDIEPWTPKQVATLVRIGRWAHERHGIPLRICQSPSDPGYGWHGMWDNTRFELADGSTPWTPSAGKVCPGPARIHQLKTVIFPAIFAGAVPEEDDMTAEQAAQLKWIHDQLRNGHALANTPLDNLFGNADRVHDALVVPGTQTAEEAFNLLFARVRNIEATVEQIAAALPDPAEPPASPSS